MLCIKNTNLSFKINITTCCAVRCDVPTLAFSICQIVADLTVTAGKSDELLYCLDSCFDVPNGDYQACNSCGDYVTCKDG